MTVVLYVCDTCNYAKDEKYLGTRTGGEVFYDCVNKAAQPFEHIRVERFSCLMNCQKHCSVALAGKDKIGYVMGGFRPDTQHAQAVVEYADKYSNSDTGQVAYKEWPQDIKGKFSSRIPPFKE